MRNEEEFYDEEVLDLDALKEAHEERLRDDNPEESRPLHYESRPPVDDEEDDSSRFYRMRNSYRRRRRMRAGMLVVLVCIVLIAIVMFLRH